MIRKNLLKYLGSGALVGLFVTSAGVSFAPLSAHAAIDPATCSAASHGAADCKLNSGGSLYIVAEDENTYKVMGSGALDAGKWTDAWAMINQAGKTVTFEQDGALQLTGAIGNLFTNPVATVNLPSSVDLTGVTAVSESWTANANLVASLKSLRIKDSSEATPNLPSVLDVFGSNLANVDIYAASTSGITYPNTELTGDTFSAKVAAALSKEANNSDFLFTTNAGLTVPSAGSTDKAYNGEEQTWMAPQEVATGADVEGMTAGTEIGEYTVTLTPKAGYFWLNNNSGEPAVNKPFEATTVTWKITPTGYLDAPVFVTGEHEYNGEAQTGLTEGYDTTNVTVTYENKNGGIVTPIEGAPKLPGTYVVKVTPNNGYAWKTAAGESTGVDNAARTSEFTIAPAKADRPNSKGLVYTWNGEKQAPALDNDPAMTHYMVKYRADVAGTQYVDEAPSAIGKWIAAYILEPGYVWADPDGTKNDAAPVEQGFVIAPVGTVERPSIVPVSFVYSGDAQTPVPANDKYVVHYYNAENEEGLTGAPVEVGQYYALVNPVAGYVWADGDTWDASYWDASYVEVPFDITAAANDTTDNTDTTDNAGNSTAKKVEAEGLASTGSETAALGVLAGLAALAGAGTLVARRRTRQ